MPYDVPAESVGYEPNVTTPDDADDVAPRSLVKHEISLP
jgi:hypothetical protein